MRHPHLLPSLLLGVSPLAAFAVAQAPITPGNLVVTRVGDGSLALSNSAHPVFLDEYTIGGTYVQTIALPTVAGGGNLPVSNSGTASSEGAITQSVDGRYLIGVGYGASPYQPGVVSTASTAVPRVVARIGLDGTVSTSTGLTDAFSGNNVRSAASLDGDQFWVAGTGSGPNRGVVYVGALGASTSTELLSLPTNCRVVGVFEDQLYVTTGVASYQGVSAVGTGLPTTSGQAAVLLDGFNALPPTPSHYSFFFASPTTLYVADDRSAANGGGIQKFTESNGTWTLQYTMAPGNGCRGLTGFVNGSVATLFATTAHSVPQLVTIVDTDVGPTSFTTLKVSDPNTAIRGVQFVRFPSGVTFGGVGCATSVGIPTIGTSGGLPVSGNANFAVTLGNAPGPTLFLTAFQIGLLSPIGFHLPGSIPCSQVYVLPDILWNGFTDGAGTASIPVPWTPPDVSLGGLPVAVQHAVFDFSFPGLDLPFATSVGMQLVVGN
ncbi:MAG: hypothetical protein KF830_12120 [Planctomycetes bacterium]|nr:hypothetical protein [Planctomycetota bacterium]